MRQLSRLLGVVSQGMNVLLLNGHPNESISGRAYRNSERGHEHWRRVMGIINAIFFWQRHHCRGAYHADLDWARQYLKDYVDRG